MRNKLLFILTLILGITILMFCPGANKAYSDTAITNPNMKSPSMTPGYNDTYFTYYDYITGYKSNGLWGFYSKTDKSVNVPNIYSDIKGLDTSYIMVKRNGEWGLINTEGTLIIPPKYDNIDSFSIDFWGDYFKVKQNNYYGVIDSKGNVLIPVSYNDLKKLDKNYIKVGQNGGYGIFSLSEKREIIPLQYDDIDVLGNLFKVKVFGKWGVMDINENEIVAPKYDDIKKLNNSYFLIKHYNLWGTASTSTGREVIPPGYDKIEYAKLNYLKVKKNGKWGIVDYSGTLIKPIVSGPFEINKVVNGLR